PLHHSSPRALTDALPFCATGAGIAHVGDFVDRDVVEAAEHLTNLADVDVGLDHVVGLGTEAEATTRAIELHLGDGVDQLVLVLRDRKSTRLNSSHVASSY